MKYIQVSDNFKTMDKSSEYSLSKLIKEIFRMGYSRPTLKQKFDSSLSSKYIFHKLDNFRRGPYTKTNESLFEINKNVFKN